MWLAYTGLIIAAPSMRKNSNMVLLLLGTAVITMLPGIGLVGKLTYDTFLDSTLYSILINAALLFILMTLTILLDLVPGLISTGPFAMGHIGAGIFATEAMTYYLKNSSTLSDVGKAGLLLIFIGYWVFAFALGFASQEEKLSKSPQDQQEQHSGGQSPPSYEMASSPTH